MAKTHESLPFNNEQSDQQIIPRHIAIIMDGNGRWATQRHLPRFMGHKAGVESLRKVVRTASDMNLGMLSIYAFSTENWGRPSDEVDSLMRIFWEVTKTDLKELHRNGVRVRHLGRLRGLAQDIQQAVQEAMDLTRNNTGTELNVCFNYGGRAEIVDAVRSIITAGVPAEQITEELISSYLYTSGLPDPDLVIRTASEMRLSNFLIWQAAYSEYYATTTLWPDFDKEDLLQAIEAYSQRKRRFGRVDHK